MPSTSAVDRIVMTVLAVAIVLTGACASFGRKHLDYTGLARADRLEVSSIDVRDPPIAMITDPSKVRYAFAFILRRQDRWGDRVHPHVPSLILQFYSGGQRLGGYGIGSKILVALPTEQGFWWRDVAEAEVDALLKALDVQYPRSQTPRK